MKKSLSLLIATLMLTAMSAFAASPATNSRTNLLEKVPAEGSYVGFAGIETLTPGFYSSGSFNGGVTTSHGIMFTRNIFAGIGAGYMADFHNDTGVIPVFADARYYFQSKYQRRILPHIGARAGAAITTVGKTGAFIQLAIGIRVPLSEVLALNVEIGPQYASRFERQHEAGTVTNIGSDWKITGMNLAFFGRINLEF